MEIKFDRRKTYILCAAVRFGDLIMCGQRHGDVYRQRQKLNLSMTDGEQGFLTSQGEFVTRYTAARIAFHAKQVDSLYEELISEHLY